MTQIRLSAKQSDADIEEKTGVYERMGRREEWSRRSWIVLDIKLLHLERINKGFLCGKNPLQHHDKPYGKNILKNNVGMCACVYIYIHTHN